MSVKMFLLTLTVVLCGVAATSALAVTAPYSVDPVLTKVGGAETRCFSEWSDPGVGGQFDPTERAILLPPWVCGAIRGSLTKQSKSPMTTWRRGVAWHAFAHEVAHVQGYDHGERTVGADCQGERIDYGLMLAAGIPPSYARQIDRAWTVPCPTA